MSEIHPYRSKLFGFLGDGDDRPSNIRINISALILDNLKNICKFAHDRTNIV